MQSDMDLPVNFYWCRIGVCILRVYIEGSNYSNSSTQLFGEVWGCKQEI